jgi:hypothetical protein
MNKLSIQFLKKHDKDFLLSMLNKSNLLVPLEIERGGCGKKFGVRIRINHPRAAGGMTRNYQESLWRFCIADKLLGRFSGNEPLL